MEVVQAVCQECQATKPNGEPGEAQEFTEQASLQVWIPDTTRSQGGHEN